VTATHHNLLHRCQEVELDMDSAISRAYLTVLLLAAAVGGFLGCAHTLPREEPLAVAPVQFGERELREVSNLFVVTDASGTMWSERTFPKAQALSTAFLKALPSERARSSSRDYNVGYIAFGGDARDTVPLQRFDRAKLVKASEKAGIMGSLDGTGGTTPFHDVIDEIGQQLEGRSGDAAVVIFSDGRADDSDAALASAKALAGAYRGRLCFDAIQIGNNADGAEFLRELGAVTSCGGSENAANLASPSEFQRYAKNVVVGTAPLPAVAAAPPSACAGAIRLRGIEFGFDKAKLDAAGKAVLDSAVEALSGCKDVRLRVEGYTDSIGTAAYNKALSEQRAKAVTEYLAMQGIAKTRLNPVGNGKDNPVASNATPDGRARNRRVELVPKQ
jgi:outer membrane protein OmpA-like peptidoglycan-associated protein